MIPENAAIHKYFVVVGLIVLTLAVYWQVANHAFINFDDPGYVMQNPHVMTGLSADNVRWAFTTIHKSNWHPLTWLSHMVDCQLYGLEPRGHHLTAVVLHVINSILLFLLFARMTGGLWRSAFVAALFALHPLHVESVAWISERKDLLSALFFILTLFAYARYADRPGAGRYLAVIAAFTLGLMAKPMLVTVPLVLLLLDYWPLNRLERGSGRRRLVVEKLPMFALSAVSSAITLYAQTKGGAVSSLQSIAITSRIENSLTAYAGYITKTVWPASLAILYPFPDRIPIGKLVGSMVLLLLVSAAVTLKRRKSPFLLMGWLWFLGTLVPVIGLVQVGVQSMADRYTYIPLIGLFVMAAWGVPELTAEWRRQRTVLAISAALLIAALSICSWLQVGYWRDSITLFSHALSVTHDNYVAHDNLANALVKEGRDEEAIDHFYQALRINPLDDVAHDNLANALSRRGRLPEAIRHYAEASRINPGDARHHSNLGVALQKQGDIGAAMEQYHQAAALAPDDVNSHYNLGVALAGMGNNAEAMREYGEALRLNPSFADAHANLGLVLAKEGRFEEAISHYRESLRLNPSDAIAADGLRRLTNQPRPVQ
jgi:protein O-mannosyl-transferase